MSSFIDKISSTVAAENKRLIALRKGKEKSARNTAVTSVNGGCTVPVRIGAENRNLPVCVALKIVNLTGFHIAFGVHINTGSFVENLYISGRFYYTIKSVTSFFKPDATHFKADDEVSLFNECVVEVTAVHASI